MAAIPLAAEPCPGRRSKVWNRRWPICSTCDLQDDSSTAEPAAVMHGDQPFCPNRRFDGTHSPGASVGVDQGGVGAVAHESHVPRESGVAISHGLGRGCNHSEHTAAVMCGGQQTEAL